MANNASPGRFYAFTSHTPATLPAVASSADSPYRRHGSGSDYLSDDSGGLLTYPYPAEQVPQGQGVFSEPFGLHYPSGFIQNHPNSVPATIYVEDPSHVPFDHFRGLDFPNYLQTAADVPFVPSAFDNLDPFMPLSMAPTTPREVAFEHHSGDCSPTGSDGSGRSDGSGHMSGNSMESASTGVVDYQYAGRNAVYDRHDVFAPQQRVEQLSGYETDHYPAYDEQRHRIGPEHARYDMDPRQPEQAYDRPRMYTYPPVGVHGIAPDMGSSEQVPPSNFPSSELQTIPMHSEDLYYDHDARGDDIIAGQTRIHIPPSDEPHHLDDCYDGMPSALYCGDDGYYPMTEDDIRRHLGLTPDQPIGLGALADPPAGQRPGQTIPVLSQLAILGSPDKRLTLQGIYDALMERFEWFRSNRSDKAWQNSIRHNLSLYKFFRRQNKPITEPGKGGYWVVDYSQGTGTKRPRKRIKRTTKGDGANAHKDERNESDLDALDSDEGFASPARGNQEIPIDHPSRPHQVAYGRGSRLPPVSASRSIARRGNSPYGQSAQIPLHGRHPRQNVQATPIMNPPGASNMRHPSTQYGGQAAYGYSMGLPSFSQAGFEQSGMPPRSANWQPGQSMHSQPPHFPPPPNAQAHMLPPPTTMRPPRSVPSRSHAIPVNIANELRNPLYNPYNLPPVRQDYEHARDMSGRFASRGATQPHAVGNPQPFVQGSSRGTRRTSNSSSGSSRE